MFELVIFDLDGTLIDSRKDIARAVNHALKELGYPALSVEQITSFVGKGVRNLMSASLGEEGKGHLSRALKIFKEYYKTHCLDETELYPGVREMVSDMSACHKAMITNKPRVFTDIVLNGLKLTDQFSTVLCGDEVAQKKPAPESVHLLLERFRVDPKRALMIGDSSFDVQMGKASGIFTCAVMYGYGNKEDLLRLAPDYWVESFADLRVVLDGGFPR